MRSNAQHEHGMQQMPHHVQGSRHQLTQCHDAMVMQRPNASLTASGPSSAVSIVLVFLINLGHYVGRALPERITSGGYLAGMRTASRRGVRHAIACTWEDARSC